MGRGRTRRFAAVVSLTLLASCAVVSDAGHGRVRDVRDTREVRDTRAASGAPGDLPGDAPTSPLGAFLDAGPDGVRGMGGLESWLGGTQVHVGHTYLPGEHWSDIEGSPELLAPWASWRQAGPGRLLVVNLPLLAHNEDGLPDARVRGLLRAGAAGRFDGHFRTLAENLVRLGVPDTVLVPGWEMNGTTYTHRCGPDPSAWKAYWRRVVHVMRAVRGQRFRFDFAPTRGRDAIPWTRCYPGDDVVDIVGMDTYDQPRGESFDRQVREPYGLGAQVRFAAAHGKPISYPEWGLFRNGDNPEYVRRMLGWMRRHKPVYQSVTDYCPHGIWQCRKNPMSSEAYRAALFPTSDPPAPPKRPEPPKEPQEPEPARPE
jgi:hypothetical protein